MGLSVGDFDNDGRQDIFGGGAGTLFGSPHALFHNNGDGTYTDEGPSAGVSNWELCWGSSMPDLDNDGFVDLLFTGSFPNAPFFIIGPGIADPGRVFLNNHDQTFTLAQTLDLENEFTSGIAVGDFDNDGFPDVAVVLNTYAPQHPGVPRLFHNTPNDNHWITVKTVGTTSNRDGIGARVMVRAGPLTQVKEVHAGSGVASMDSRWLTFGLGRFSHARITVTWPSGRVERFHPQAVDRSVKLVEGTGAPVRSHDDDDDN
jgi:hypothetical protein